MVDNYTDTGTAVAGAGATEGLTYLNLVNRISSKRYNTITPDATQKTDCQLLCNDGYRKVLGGSYYDPQDRTWRHHDWSFLSPAATLIAFASVAVDADVKVTASTTTVTATAASFHPGMVGHSIVITGDATYTITGYTSTTEITISSSSTASGATFSIDSEKWAAMPATFGGMVDTFTYSSDNIGGSLQHITPGEMAKQWGATSNTGDPYQYALEARTFAGGTGQRWKVVWNCYPGTDRILDYRYRVLWSELATDDAYPLGGMLTNDAIYYAALSRHEEDQGGAGIYKARFDEEMFKAVKLDQGRGARNLGMMIPSGSSQFSRDVPTTGYTYTS